MKWAKHRWGICSILPKIVLNLMYQWNWSCNRQYTYKEPLDCNHIVLPDLILTFQPSQLTATLSEALLSSTSQHRKLKIHRCLLYKSVFEKPVLEGITSHMAAIFAKNYANVLKKAYNNYLLCILQAPFACWIKKLNEMSAAHITNLIDAIITIS